MLMNGRLYYCNLESQLCHNSKSCADKDQDGKHTVQKTNGFQGFEECPNCVV